MALILGMSFLGESESIEQLLKMSWKFINDRSANHLPAPLALHILIRVRHGWFSSRVLACFTQVQKARIQIAVARLSGNSLRQTAHTHCTSVHQAAKLVAALLRVAGVTAGLAESNGEPTSRFMTYVTCRLTAKNRDQLWNPTLGNRVWLLFYNMNNPTV